MKTNNRDDMNWFACYPEKWLTALQGMKPPLGVLYFIICLRIYDKRGPVPNDPDEYAQRLRIRRKRAAELIAKLIERKNLYLTEDGRLMNERCALEIAEGNEIAEKRSLAAKARWAKRRSETVVQKRWNSETHMNVFDGEKVEQNQLPLDASALRCNDNNNNNNNNNKREGPRASRRAPRQPMKENWEVDEQDISYGEKLGFSREKITSQLGPACRDYHLRHGTLIAGEVGLHATFRTWCNNEVKFKRERNVAIVENIRNETMHELSNGRKVPWPDPPKGIKTHREMALWRQETEERLEREYAH